MAANTNKKDVDSFSKITSEKAGEIIRRLAGNTSKYHKKLIDNLVVITSASGGAGASTIAANVAFMAQKRGINTIVIDMNILMPIQQLYFRIEQKMEKPDLVGYLLGANTLGEAIDQGTASVSVMYANNRSLMDYIACENDAAIRNFQSLIETLRSLYDLIIIDCPMKVENTLCNTAMYMADKIYMVWDEGIGSISNTEKIRRNMAYSGINTQNKLFVILNKRTSIQYSKYPFQKLEIQLIGYLPFEQAVIESSLRSNIFCDKGESNSKNARYFVGGIKLLTDKIIEIGGFVDEGGGKKRQEPESGRRNTGKERKEKKQEVEADSDTITTDDIFDEEDFK